MPIITRTLISLALLLAPQNAVFYGSNTSQGGPPPPPPTACSAIGFGSLPDQNPIVAPWHIPSGARALQVKGGKVQATIASPNENSAYCLDTSSAPANQFSEVTIGSVAGDDFAGPAVRISNGPTYYVAWARPSASLIYLYKVVNGSLTQMAALNSSVSVGTRIRLRISGSTMTVSVNGTDIGSHTDSAITSGQFGMSIFVTANINDLSFSSWNGGVN